MKKYLLLTTVVCMGTSALHAQNTSPFWSLAGNSNATAASKLGTTNAQPLRLFTDNDERMRIAVNGRVSIGTTSGIGKLNLQGNGSVPSSKWLISGTPVMASFGESGVGNGDYILSMASNTFNARSVVLMRKSRGTLASPTAVAINDFMGSLLASGYDGNAFQNPVSVDFFADGAPSSGNVPGRISLSTGTNSGNRLERLVVKNNGNVGIGTTSPAYLFDVAGAARFTGSVGIRGNPSTSYALNVNAGASYDGIQVTDPVNNYVLFSSKSGLNAGIYISKSSTTSGTACIQGAGSGSSDGVYGTSGSGIGVQGFGTSYRGISGSSTTGTGVYGSTSSSPSDGNYAGYFVGNNWRGIYAQSASGYFAGYFNGEIYSTATFVGSDTRLKKDIQDIGDAMSIINRLQPKYYEFRMDGNYSLMNLPKGQHYGLLAQDVEKVLPALVKEANFNTRSAKAMNHMPSQDGKEPAQRIFEEKGEEIEFKAVNYTELTPIIIKALQEQQAQIEAIDKQTEVEALRKEVAELKAMVTKLTQGGNIYSLSNASLGAATPNPATGTTILSYNLPQESRGAYILVTDMKGSTLKRITVNGVGANQVRLNTNSLAAGTYTYSLFVNGSKVDSKQLLITR